MRKALIFDSKNMIIELMFVHIISKMGRPVQA